MRTIAAVLACSSLLTIGCADRHHLADDFGTSYVNAFAVQAGPPKEASEPVTGLDSQEAAITADNYRATLVPEGQQAEADPVILVAPPSRERAQPLQPSVPRE